MVIMSSKPRKIKRAAARPVLVAEDSPEDGDGEKIPKEILIIAQEVKIVKSLVCNDLIKRNRQMRKLRKWLQLRTQSSFAFTEEDFLRIWKGLYYNMWMSDKPLVQEELAEQLGQLLECFEGDVATAVNFFGSFLRTMCQEWFGIDQWRIDKFLMLVRRMLRYMFRVLKSAGWATVAVQLFNEHMLSTVLAETTSSTGLTMHFLDIFCEELAKVSEGQISADQVGLLVRPFVTFLGTQRDTKLISHCRTRIFYHLLYQSALGREYTEKYNAWKELGFPTGCIDNMEKAEDSEEGEQEEEGGLQNQKSQQRHLDPRAGNVDVFMPELPLDAKHIVEELELFIYKRESSTKCRKMLKKLLEVFQTYQRGEFPLGIKTMPRFEEKSQKPLIKDKISQLENLENEMYGIGRKLKMMNKRKRRKLLKSLNFDNVDDANFDQVIEKALPKQYLKERKKRKGAMMSGWLEEHIADDTQADDKPKKLKKKVADIEKPVSITPIQKQKHKKPQQSSDDEPAKKLKKLDNTETTTIAETVVPAKEKTITTAKSSEVKKNVNQTLSEWDTPLNEGEVEYFIPSRKLQLRKANANMVPNPLAKKVKTSSLSTPKKLNKSTTAANTPKTPNSIKRVKIALKNNTAQNPSEYIQQIKSSPNVPYDADKKPGKGLLKPNSMPSPINPFYKKKIGLRLLNDTL